jgi:hypothetical protein
MGLEKRDGFLEEKEYQERRDQEMYQREMKERMMI